ncbi:MAG: FAD:protein FMN transferase, partial [Dehalococcoidia bacterium]
LVLSIWVDSLFAALAGLLVVALSLFSVAFYSELGQRAYKKYMWMWIGARTLALVLPLVFYLIWSSTAALLAGLTAAYFIFGTWAFRHFTAGLAYSELKRKMGFSLRAWGSSIAGVSLSFLDKIIIGALFPLGILAVYQFSFRVFLLLAIVPNALFFYLLPERSGGGEVRRLERIGVFLSIGLALAMFFLAPAIAGNVFPEFREGIDTIRIMGLAIIPSTLARIRSSELYSTERESVVLGASLFGLAIGISCIMIVFSQGFGLIGLAASMLASQLGFMAGLLVLPRLLNVGRKGRIGLGFLGVIVASALMMSSFSIVFPRMTVEAGKVRGTHLAMDTVVTIQVVADGEEEIRVARQVIREAFSEIDRIEKLMSATDPASDVYRLNSSGTQWVELSPEVIYVLRKGKEYSVLTDGSFDVTVKPLVDFWMEEVKRSGKIPTSEQLSGILELVNYSDLIIDSENSRARFASEGMEVTLGGIAKGYAVDRACEILMDRGIGHALVDIGGDIRAIGTTTWSIGIADPRVEGRLLGVIELQSGAIATSGDYQRYHLIGAERVHHIIDPRTGEPARGSMSITIVATDTLAADALSTGIFVMGPDEGKILLDAIGVAGLMIDSEGRITTSDSWDYDMSD